MPAKIIRTLSEFPKIAKEWDYQKNGNLTPKDVGCFSNKKVWWICDKGHSYYSAIHTRIENINNSGNGCPVCSNKIAVPGFNDLETTNPNLIKYWDYQKNGKLLPSNVVAGSERSVWWICDKGHSYRTKIYNMVHSRKGMNCPVCTNRVVLEGFNDLATTHPHLVGEWDYDKNRLKPNEVHAGLATKVWWKCKKFNHSWYARIQTRAIRGAGCPVCLNQQLLVGFNDFGTLNPEIYKYWDEKKNDGKKPSDFIGLHSNKSVYLKCDKDHSYKVKINDYTKGHRCPICQNKQILIGYNDLTTTHPNLAKEWDYQKNGALLPEAFSYGSDKKVWWKCIKGHSWQATINSRVGGKGCPICSKEYQTSMAEKAVGYYLSKQFNDLQENVYLPELNNRELDVYIPSLKLAVEYDGCTWHKIFENDLAKDMLCFRNNITLIRIREEGCAEYDSSAYFIKACRNHGNIVLLEKPINETIALINKLFSLDIPIIEHIENDLPYINERFFTYAKNNSLLNKNPELAKEWNYERNETLTPEMISVCSNKKVWWICNKGHEWMANVGSRTRGVGCPFCSGRLVLLGYNDLKTTNQNLCKEWNYVKNGDLKPEDFSNGSDKKVWWICNKGHEWEASIASRAKGSGCPFCSGLYAIEGENDLKTLFPEIAHQWDYEKNGDLFPNKVVPGSEKRVWWICNKGHSYSSIIRSRTILKTGCPICKNLKVLAGYNDLETLHPNLAKEWNYKKNNNLLPSQVGGGGGSHRKVWWICNKGHEWNASLSSRISLKTGCPICAINKTKKKK